MKIDRIIDILNKRIDINGWKLKQTNRETYEQYYIKRDLEMNRAKNIEDIYLTVYKDFYEEGSQFKGSSTTTIHPTMTKSEVIKAIDEATYASRYAKVEYYPLVKPEHLDKKELASNFKDKSLEEYLSLMVEAIFKADDYKKGLINSTEVFLSKINTRLINSLGIDYSVEKYMAEVEFITNWNEDKEEIELFRHIDMGEFDGDKLTKEVQEMFEMSKARALSKPTPALGVHRVILTGESVKQLLKYYYSQSNAAFVYEKYSNASIGKSIQGEKIIGDKINMTLKPHLKGSSFQSIFDNDGVILKDINIIKDGILNQYWGNQRYSYYLKMEPTGEINNYEVTHGMHSIEKLKETPYLEVVSFSSFQMDEFTGDFGGEIRLGWYYDGNKTIPVSGGSISGNIKEKQNELYLSKEMISINDYFGPKHIVFNDIVVAGN